MSVSLKAGAPNHESDTLLLGRERCLYAPFKRPGNSHDEEMETKPMTGSLTFIEVMLAQSVLQQSGYYHGPVDGTLSKSARHALMGFQKDGGLEVTGELDDELFHRLLALRQELVYATDKEQLMARAKPSHVLRKHSQEMRSGLLWALVVGLIGFLYFAA
jgi:hypothetical protein